MLWATTSSSGVLRQSCQASFPAPCLPIGVLITFFCYSFCFMLALCSDALFESRILSTRFPKANLYICHLPPITFCLLFELALRVLGMLRSFKVMLSYRVGKLSHALLYGYEMDMIWRLVGYKMLEINMIYFCYNYTCLSRGIGESFCLFSDGSLVSPRTPSSHELF
jgi:hypothetical protein